MSIVPLNRRTLRPRDELLIAIIVCIEPTYHRRCRQARLGGLTTVEHETIVNLTAILAT